MNQIYKPEQEPLHAEIKIDLNISSDCYIADAETGKSLFVFSKEPLPFKFMSVPEAQSVAESKERWVKGLEWIWDRIKEMEREDRNVF